MTKAELIEQMAMDAHSGEVGRPFRMKAAIDSG